MKIGQKLVLGFISVALLVTAAGYFSASASKKPLEITIGNASELLAAKMMEHIDTIICNRIELIQSIAKDLMIQKVILESNREFEKIDNIQTIINQRDYEWTSVSRETKTAFMEDLLNNDSSRELKEKLNFYEKKYGYAIFGEIFVSNKYGANVAQTDKTTDYYQADEQWWQDAKNNRVYVADVEYDESSDIYSTDICVRVDDENDNFVGVIKAVLNIHETINFMKKTAADEVEERDFKLLDRNRKQIYETEEHEKAESLPKELLLHFADDKKSGHGTGFITAFDLDDKEYKVFAYAHSKGYKDFKGLGWTLVIENKTEQIFSSITKLKKTILAASGLITILAIIIGLIISRSISRAIGKVSLAAAKIGEGDLDCRLKIESNDEIGQLAASFNKMVEDLVTTTTSIASLNKEITERQKAEERLRYERDFTRSIIETAQTIILVLDTECKVINFNPYMEELSGYRLEDVKGKDWIETFLPQKDQQYIRTLFKNAVNDIQTRGVVNTIVTKDGRQVEIEWYDKTLKDDDGNVISVVSIGQDVTERKQMEDTLRSSQLLLEGIINAIPVRVFWKDKNLVYLGCNTIFAHDAGFANPNDIIGKDDYQMGWHDQAELYRSDDHEVIQSGSTKLLIEEPQTTPEGNTITLLTSKLPLRTSEGDICGVLGTYIDVTERKQYEDKQAELLKQVEKANQELKEFAYVASHDLKAPLRGISTLAGWISSDYSDKLGEEGKEQLDLLLKRVDRMQKLIDGILQYSRVGRIEEEKKDIDLNQLIPEIIDLIAPPKNIEITINNPLPVIKCEETRITQVFQNLLSNAVKYMDKTEGRIGISYAEENNFWKFAISDNGPGIEEKHFERIFQIFQTLSGHDDKGGTGIGLTLVKKIVELNGGRVWLESETDKGSTFYFTLSKTNGGKK